MRMLVAFAIAIAPACLGACSILFPLGGLDGEPDADLNDARADVVAPVDGPSPDQTALGSDSTPPFDAQDGAVSMDDVAQTPDASLPEASPPDSPPDAPGPDTSYTPQDAGCGATAWPAMVQVSNFCIDSTEVTVAQYADFLRVKNGNTSGQPAVCQWNTTFTPQNWPPAGSPDQAVAGVNWCDAYMYCAWAGKRLCGAIGGGPSDPADWVNPAVSEWFNVCTHNNDGSHTYPYGNTYDPSACNGTDFGAHAPLTSQSTCQGGYPGVYDMSGNVIEWEDSCSSAAADSGDPPGADDCCNLRGGGYNQGSGQLRCDLGLCTARAAGGGDNGFRCCSQ